MTAQQLNDTMTEQEFYTWQAFYAIEQQDREMAELKAQRKNRSAR